jgi:four helix bundle protein
MLFDVNYFTGQGSSFETQSHLIYATKIRYFENEKVNKMILDYDELVHDLNKIIKSLE